MNAPKEAIKQSDSKKSFLLTKDHLTINNPEDHERGQQTPDGESYLIRFPELERIVWKMPLRFTTRNPFQPREDFPEDKIKEMVAALESVGQLDPIKVIPIISASTKENVRLILLDGEIRTIAAKRINEKNPTLDGIVSWEPNNDRLFEKSAVLNLVRTGHNPIELAKIFKKLLEAELKKDGVSKKEAMLRVTVKMKTNAFTVYKHLQLLNLSEPIQQLIRTRKISANSAFLIPQEKRKLGDKFDEAMLAQQLLKEAAGVRVGRPPKNKKESTGKITRTGVKYALQEMRKKAFEGGTIEDAEMNAIVAASNVVRFTSKVADLRRATRHLLNEQLRDATIKAMRERKHTPPEKQHESLVKLLGELNLAFSDVIRPAILPEPLEIPPGSPTFSEVVKHTKFREPIAREIAILLANASDNKGEILTAAEICEALKKRNIELSPKSTGPFFRSLMASLKPKGLTVDAQEKRKKGTNGFLHKIPGYRLRWIKKGGKINTENTES